MKIHLMSRKTWALIAGVLGALLGVLNQWFELGINVQSFMAAFGLVTIWLFFEARADIAAAVKKIGGQAHRFRDPKFWIAAVSAVLAVLNESLSWGLPVNEIVAFLGIIMAFLFKKDFNRLASGMPR